MRNLRLLLLVAAVAAVGSYSAFAGAGSLPVTDPSVAGSQRTGADAAGSTSVLGQEGQAAEDGKGSAKKAQAIADEFGVSKDEVLARHNEGIGFGALFKLYGSRFLMEHFWAALLVLFAFAFLLAEGLAWLERRVDYYAASRS